LQLPSPKPIVNSPGKDTNSSGTDIVICRDCEAWIQNGGNICSFCGLNSTQHLRLKNQPVQHRRTLNHLPDHALIVCKDCCLYMGGIYSRHPETVLARQFPYGDLECDICDRIGEWDYYLVKEWTSLTREEHILKEFL
jgi:hypothetical protein